MNPIICIPTFNEELNIKKSLKKLRWAKKIIILDSKSTDKTIDISKKFRNVKLISLKKSYDYVSKLNYLINKTKNKWILLLDADYVLSNELIKKGDTRAHYNIVNGDELNPLPQPRRPIYPTNPNKPTTQRKTPKLNKIFDIFEI